MFTDTLAKDIMTRNVLTVSEEWTVPELARFLTNHSISGAPVTNAEGKLVGVVSVTDIARAADSVTARWVEPSTLYHHEADLGDDDLGSLVVEVPGDLTVSQVMTSVVFQVDGNSTVSQIADTMVRGRIHRVFVVEAGKITGVISALDLLRGLC
jgi:CBS domain-containing protein